MENDDSILERQTHKNIWTFGNDVLYEMCRANPKHIEASIIVGKMWLIGRAYAAAIERRRHDNEKYSGDDFYCYVVAPKMLEIGPQLDEFIEALKRHKSITRKNLKEIVDAHTFLTKIFFEISGQKKRSLASKYLHFHIPHLFYIYDSRAVQNAKRIKSLKVDKHLEASLISSGDPFFRNVKYIQHVVRLFALQGTVHGVVNTN